MAVKTKIVFRDEAAFREKLAKDPRITRDDKIGLATWISEAGIRGLSEIQNEPANNDIEETTGKWLGYRSALINKEGRRVTRVIYEEIVDGLIEVAEIITIDPDYYDTG